MSTITSLGASDNGATSRTVINTNFTNLNTDKVETSVIDTDTTLSANSDSKIPSQKAIKTYVDSLGSVSTGLKQTLTAGATINGATTPVPVYQNKTDNEVYACDANDTNAMKFMGFATTNSTNGNSIDVVTTGLVSGFSGLSEGEKYYLSDTAGAISTTPGTYEVLVGIAISETQLVIQKGARFASGTTTFTSTTTTAITCGFRPSVVRIHAFTSRSTARLASSGGGWTVFGGNNCAYNGWDGTPNPTSGVNATAWYLRADGAAVHHTGNITSITDTGFTLDNTETTDGTTANIYWEAYGQQ